MAIVGAGPAGIVTAMELTRGGLDVLLIESGKGGFSRRAQSLADEAKLDPQRHAPMSMATRRQIGGASAIWGGRCVPYDPIDFEPRDLMCGSTWPVGYEAYTQYFQRACDWMQCGRAAFDRRELNHLPPSIVPGLPDGDVRTSTFERWSLPTNFGTEYRALLRDSRRLRLVTELTCTEVVCAPEGRRVDHLRTRGLDGRPLTVRARRYVLACGGLETTRLLLASRDLGGNAVGNHSGHLGRWYMGHAEGIVARVHFTTPPRDTIFGYERDIDMVYVRRRFSFTAEAQKRLGLPNIVAWLANPLLPDPIHRSGLLSVAYLALASPLGAFFAPDAQRMSLTGHSVPGAPYGPAERGPVLEHAKNLIREPGPTARFIVDFGARRFLSRRRRVPGFFVYNSSNVYPLQYHGEQVPNPDSRVTLSRSRDDLGMPRLNIDVRFSEHDVRGVVEAHQHWDEYLRRHGCGRIEYLVDDVAGAIEERLGAGFHQVGTTRMSARAEDGVLTPDLAVHGFSDLFVASSSALVTSGQANSTFMIVVLALRLADQLRAELHRGDGRPARARLGVAQEPRTVAPLRILFTTARYVPYSGGTEIHTYEVAKRLSARGAEVTVASTVTGDAGPRESFEEGVRVLRVHAWPPNRDYYLAPALARIVRNSRTDIIHCQGYHTLVAPLVMLAAWSAGIPYVVTLHSGGHSSDLRHRLRPLQAWLLRPLLMRARRLIAVSMFEAELFARRLRLPPSSFVVIPSGVDMPVLPFEPRSLGPPLVVSVGRLESYKGHQRVMEAVTALRAARPDIRVHFIGSGAYEPQLRHLARRLGVTDMVEIGSIPPQDRVAMARILSQASVVASLSGYESQGLAMQEALALGRPLVVSSDTALGELTRYPNVSAVKRRASSDRVAEAILSLLDAPPAQPPVMPTWDDSAEALIELYHEILAQDA